MDDRGVEPSDRDDLFRWYMRRNDQDLKYIRERVDKLWDFRLLILGGALSLGAIGGFMVNLVLVFVRK